jgi:hypothetical protein
MIDRSRCMAPRDDASFGGPMCQKPATHETILGRRCAHHAEDLRVALRSPNTLMNILSGLKIYTEEEIARVVVELPS